MSSNSRALSCTFWPGVSTSSVGVTCTCAGAPVPTSAGVFTARPVGVVARRAPMAYTASLDTKKMRPRETAAPASTCSGVPSEPQQLATLFGSSTALRIVPLSAPGRTMKNLPPSVPT